MCAGAFAGALLPSGARTNLRAVALRARRPWKLYGNVADPVMACSGGAVGSVAA